MSNYIVTGGAGFIGHHLVTALLNLGHEVCILDDLSTGKSKRIAPGAEFVECDITGHIPLAVTEKYKDGIFHLAALPRVQFSIDNPILTNKVNLLGTLKILEVARKWKIKKVVFASSSSVYGDKRVSSWGLNEASGDLRPMSPYALQKLTSESYCKLYHDLYGLNVCALRFFNVYGPGMEPDDAYAQAIALFLEQRKNGKPMTITGDGDQTRDFTHVEDVIRGLILSMELDTTDSGKVINLGRGKACSMNSIAKMIGGPTVNIKPRIEPRHTLADNRKAKKLLGWEPTVSIEEGIEELCQLHNLRNLTTTAGTIND